MSNGDGIVPTQGLNVINEKKTLYGLPLTIPTGGGSTKVTLKLPLSLKWGSGAVVKITGGDGTPATLPPVYPGGVKRVPSGSGQIVRILSPPSIRGESWVIVRIITPIKICNGSSVKTAKT